MHPNIGIKEIAIILYIGKHQEEPVIYRNELIGTTKDFLETGGLIEKKYHKPSGIDYYTLTEKGVVAYDNLVKKLSDLEIRVEFD